MRHQLNGGKQLAFPTIIGAHSQRALENRSCFFELLQFDQACCISVQSVSLSVEQRSSFFEMRNSGRAVSLLVFQHREHAMAGAIDRSQTHDAF